MKNIISILILIFICGFSYAKKRESGSSSQKLNSIQDLRELVPLSDVVVIQRRYLRKTLRGELALSSGLLLSSPFFINPLAGVRASFYFLEKHGIEFYAFYTFGLERSLIKELRDKVQIHGQITRDQTESVISFSYKYIPIYGKMSLFNRKIIPFEGYLTVGAAIARAVCSLRAVEGLGLGRCALVGTTQKKKKWDIASIVGIGQSYVINKNFSIQVDLKWVYYGIFTGNTHHHDISLSVGGSVFIPYLRER